MKLRIINWMRTPNVGEAIRRWIRSSGLPVVLRGLPAAVTPETAPAKTMAEPRRATDRRLTVSSHRFTLIEIVVAVAILALLGLLIGMSAQTFYRSYSQAQKVSTELRRNQAVDRLVEAHFMNAVPFEWEDDSGEVRYVFMGEKEEMYLTSLQRTYGREASALWFIRLYCEDEMLKCDYSPTPLLPWLDVEEQPHETEVIATGVRFVDFLYAERYDDEIRWLEVWEEDEHGGIPLAIQITVEWLDGSKERWLRRTAGSSGNSTLGDRAEPSE